MLKGTKVLKFKTGDYVRTLAHEDIFGNQRFPLRTEGIIVGRCEQASAFPYEVTNGMHEFYYMEDELELINKEEDGL